MTRLGVRAGDLRHRVVLERPVRTGDGGGGSDVSWVFIAEVWAAIFPRSADETFVHDRVAGRATHDIWIRKRTGIGPEMRVRLESRRFDLKGVIDEGRGKYLRCPAEERDL